MGMTHERHVSLRTTCLRCFTPVKRMSKKEDEESARKGDEGEGGEENSCFSMEED